MGILAQGGREEESMATPFDSVTEAANVENQSLVRPCVRQQYGLSRSGDPRLLLLQETAELFLLGLNLDV